MTPARSSDAILAALNGNEPTPEQWVAISHPAEPLHLVAGAGSGKTAVMAARIVWAIENLGLSPSEILGLTFTNKASEELQSRVRAAVTCLPGRTHDEITVQTYHSFAAAIVREYGLLVGVEPESGLLSDAQQWQLLLSCLDDLPAFEALEVRSSRIVTSALKLASSLADHLVGPNDVEAAADRMMAMNGVPQEVYDNAARRKELCSVVVAYQSAKARASRIDFGDQVTKAVEILEQHAEVRRAYRMRYPFVLLDEYQDTNVAQRRLIRALVGHAGAVTAVGDARQAIYAFRGATMYNLIRFADHFERSDGRGYDAVSLSENFRSGARILQAANAVVAAIAPERRPGAPLRPLAGNGAGSVAVGLFSDERAEASWIASRCESVHGRALGPGREPCRWRDMAILVRRKAAMDAILDALESADVPVEVIGLGGLLKAPEIVEIVAWLRSLETRPGANRWLARVLLGPRWRIHPRDLSLCAMWAASRNWDLRVGLAGGDEALAWEVEPRDVGFSLVEVLGNLDEIAGLGAEARRRLREFGDRLDTMRAKTSAPLLDLVQEVIRQAGIADALDASGSRAAPAAKQNVSNFLDQVASFAPVEGEATLRSFLAYLDAAEEAEETLEAAQPAEQDSVKLMTVHAAKGLEFECVFVPSVAAGRNAKGEPIYSIFPNTKSSNPLTSHAELPYEVREDARDLPRFEGQMSRFREAVRVRVLEDERRLFYVALTRAKQSLAVTCAWWYGRDKSSKGPSVFWDELEALSARGVVDVAVRDDAPEENPLYEALEERREWPPVARAGVDDGLFPEGAGRVADELNGGTLSLEALLENLPEDERAAAEGECAAHIRDIDLIASGTGAEVPSEASLPGILSATSLVRLQAGAIGAWDLVRPLPERPTRARRVGTEVHRLIEARSRSLSPYPEESELDEPAEISRPSALAAAMARWEQLGFGRRKLARLPSGEPMVELPFALRWEERIVRGRIDAVYETDDGGLEIVDFKTGRRFEPVEEADQLGIYAHALRANGLLPEGTPVTLTYAFLDGEEPERRRL